MANVNLENVSLKELSEAPHTDMDSQQKDIVLQLTYKAFDEYEKMQEKGKEEREASILSLKLKSSLDKAFGANWFAIVGQSYVASFDHSQKTYFHFYYRKYYITAYRD